MYNVVCGPTGFQLTSLMSTICVTGGLLKFFKLTSYPSNHTKLLLLGSDTTDGSPSDDLHDNRSWFLLVTNQINSLKALMGKFPFKLWISKFETNDLKNSSDHFRPAYTTVTIEN